MNGRRLARAIGLTVAVGVATAALTSSAAAGPPTAAPARAEAVIVTAQPAPVRVNAEARALIRKAMAHMGSLRATGSGVICLGGTNTSSLTSQSCSFNGSSGVCIQQSTDPGANQTCTFTQAGGRNNLAIVLQVIVQRSSASTGTQSGTQDAEVTQQGTTKSNLSFVMQIVKQSLGTGANNPDSETSAVTAPESSAESSGTLPNFSSLISSLMASEPLQEGDEPATPATYSGDVTQTQQSQQKVDVDQSGQGNNLSSVYQSLRMRERASNASTITQTQNPTDGSCLTSAGSENMCAIVTQNTTAGKNASGLVQLYRQFQSGSNTTALTQSQDPGANHGLDHDVQQTSGGSSSGPLDTALTFQWGHQVQRASNGGTVVQTQDPRVGKGPDSFQSGNSSDTWNGTQLAQQLQTVDGQLASGGFQNQLLTYQGTSSGTIDATETGTQNGNTATNQCSGSSCEIAVTCTSGGESEVPAAAETVDACEGTVPPGGGPESVMLRR